MKIEELVLNDEGERRRFYDLLVELGVEDFEEEKRIQNISKSIPDVNFADLIRERIKNFAVISVYAGGFYIETDDGLIEANELEIIKKQGIFSDSISLDLKYYEKLIKSKNIIYRIKQSRKGI